MKGDTSVLLGVKGLIGIIDSPISSRAALSKVMLPSAAVMREGEGVMVAAVGVCTPESPDSRPLGVAAPFVRGTSVPTTGSFSVELTTFLRPGKIGDPVLFLRSDLELCGKGCELDFILSSH